MKTKLFILVASLAPVSLFAQQSHSFTITGKIGHYNSPAKMYLDYVEGNQEHSDSAIVKDGHFKFVGTTNTVSKAHLVLKRKGQSSADSKSFYLEAGMITAYSDSLAKDFKVAGTVNNNDNDRFLGLFKGVGDRYVALEKERSKLTEQQQNDDKVKDIYDRRVKALLSERDSLVRAFIKQNPNSFVSLYNLVSYAEGREYDEIAPLFQNLSPVLKNSYNGKHLEAQLLLMEKVRIGAIAPEFTLPDSAGNRVTLSSFRGKYVLVDFWASWCSPCREENPHLVKTYLQYKGHSFDIVSISLDQQKSRKAWLKAIHNDGLLWPQVSDLSGFNNPAAKSYGVNAIPQNFLLDRDGRIIAKNLRGNDLERKLKEVFHL